MIFFKHARGPRPSQGLARRSAGLLIALSSVVSVGCAQKVTRVGLVDTASPRTALVETTGERHRLGLEPGTDEAQLAALGGCLVQVEGMLGLRGLDVGSYRVLDAGDGSAPFIGQLREEHGQLIIFDRQGAGDLRLVAGESGGALSELRPLLGQDIMVLGFVVGNQSVQVVRWRSMGPHLGAAGRR